MKTENRKQKTRKLESPIILAIATTLIFSSTSIFAQGSNDLLASAIFVNGVAELDISATPSDVINYTFTFGNESDCDYIATFCFSSASDCSVACVVCATPAGTITANTTSSTFSYSTPLTGCVNDYPCKIRISQSGTSNSAFANPCYGEIETSTTVGCDYNGSTNTYGCDFYECGEIRIYEIP